jgi:ribosomal-protein-alanine N-acetyltransferase
MVNVEIIRADIEHIDDIMIVENLCFKIPWSRGALVEEITRNQLAIYYSAKVDTRIVGYAGMWSVYGESHITNIAVHPEYRECGTGSKLLERLIDTAKKLKIKSMTLEVRKSNLAAQGLYKKYGFQTYGLRKSYYANDGEDALIMWKYGIY